MASDSTEDPEHSVQSNPSARVSPSRLPTSFWYGVLIGLLALVAAPILLGVCGVVGMLWPRPFPYGRDAIVGACPARTEFIGRWRPTAQGLAIATASGADPARTRDSYLELDSNGELRLHDVPCVYLDLLVPCGGPVPMSLRGTWDVGVGTEGTPGLPCDVNFSIPHHSHTGEDAGTEGFWVGRANGRLRISLLYGDPDDQDPMLYEHEAPLP